MKKWLKDATENGIVNRKDFLLDYDNSSGLSPSEYMSRICADNGFSWTFDKDLNIILIQNTNELESYLDDKFKSGTVKEVAVAEASIERAHRESKSTLSMRLWLDRFCINRLIKYRNVYESYIFTKDPLGEAYLRWAMDTLRENASKWEHVPFIYFDRDGTVTVYVGTISRRSRSLANCVLHVLEDKRWNMKVAEDDYKAAKKDGI